MESLFFYRSVLSNYLKELHLIWWNLKKNGTKGNFFCPSMIYEIFLVKKTRSPRKPQPNFYRNAPPDKQFQEPPYKQYLDMKWN